MACHTAEPAANGSPPLFTDNSYDNLGVPLPVHLRSQGQRHDNDAGLCAQVHVRERADAKNYCGAFKVPSLRNVALRRAFFHNASLQQLRDVVAFYATRDTDPQRWYGVNKALNDVKPAYRANVNRDEAPYGQKPGEQPRLNEQDIDDMVAFLHTLTDADLAARAASLAGSTAVANAAVHAAAPVAIPKVVTSR
jgi:cytochrome c peroxidase